MSVKIKAVKKNSPCFKKGVSAGDFIAFINNNAINDVFDYRFYMTQKKLKIVVRKPSGYYAFVINKGEYDDIGLEFDTYLMDEQHSCYNNCVFCFVDQMPKGMRDSLYFKDDDARLSFLFGNYITLTNLKDSDVKRIIDMKISPINISVHSTNKDLRVEMMKNRFAGEKLDYMKTLADAGIKMNAQLVLCPGINDGKELIKTLEDLSALYPNLQSIACVPVGLTKFREGLFELSPYTEESASETIEIVENFAASFKAKNNTSLAFCSDEFYIKAKKELKSPEYYEDYPQLDNGVGMLSLFCEEFTDAAEAIGAKKINREISCITGVDAYKYIKQLADYAKEKFGVQTKVYAIENDFFGENITVAGLITATDIIAQLKDKDLGEYLIIPDVMIRKPENIFLDDMSVEELSQKLGVEIKIIGSDGADFFSALINK